MHIEIIDGTIIADGEACKAINDLPWRSRWRIALRLLLRIL